DKESSRSADKFYLVGIKKRKAMLAFSELLYLRNKVVQQMPELPLDVLSAFNGISGNEISDAWIRKEVKLRTPSLSGSAIFPIFVTGDLVNSMASVAEAIDTVYVSEKINVEPENLKADQLGRFLEYLAALFQTISISDIEKKINIKGFWSGISISDLYDHIVLSDVEQ
ncbi:MAG: hypothetical protein KGJ07_08705, partial [Patescibacteria group bacterium]|nr:hypothetical protein [Patescibacteria group bacterium]